MIKTDTYAFARPRHLFDVPAFTVWALAAAGSASIRLAYALDVARSQHLADNRSVHRPRARLGPSESAQTDHLVPDSWRVR